MKRSHNVDRGSVLVLVLVVVVVLSIIVVATATYATSTLKFGQVVEGRADRLSAAEGGMRDVLNRIDNNQFPICATAAGAGTGVNVQVPNLNDATVVVNCRQLSSTLAANTSWAIIVTGAGGVPASQGLTTRQADTKVFDGPTFIANRSLFGLQQPLKIDNGDLFYTDPSCSDVGDYKAPSFLDTDPGDGQSLTFNSSINGLWCTNKSWNNLFPAPALPASLPTAPPPPYADIAGCRVFYPGLYTSAPAWASSNYMMSGNYVFALPAAAPLIDVQNATVTAGREGIGGDQQEIDNPACDNARDTLDTPGGATFYLDGKTHIRVESNGSLEILRRKQPDAFVSVQTLPSHTLNWTTASLSSKSGNNKQMAIHGYIWSPFAAVEFGNVTNATVAQILGGAAVARVEVNSSASATGLVIGVLGGPSSDKWALTSTATKGGTSTTVRVIADVRFSSVNAGTPVWEVAVKSWRVCSGGC